MPNQTQSMAYRAAPRFISALPDDVDVSGAHRGAQALGLTLLPQGEELARVLEARRDDGKPLYKTVVTQMSRRSSKTSAIQATLLARAFDIPGTKIVQTAQSQRIARRVFLDMCTALENAYPDEESRPFRVRIGNGQEDVKWDNGSVWWVVSPKASAFRSAAADVVWVDEAGEFTDEQSRDLIEGVMALMDTRPAGQLIISGTPARTRSGLLWDYLVKGREGKGRVGILDYSMDPADDPTSEDVWWRCHPGLASGLTDIETMRERHEDMPLVSWVREYLCGDPSNASISAVDPEDWEATSVPDVLVLPTSNYALAFATAPDGSAAAVAAAWYDDDGRPHIQVVDYRAGISHLPNYIARLIGDNRSVPILFDTIGNNTSVYQDLQRKPGLRLATLEPVSLKQCAAGVSTLLTTVSDRSLVHARDKDLDAAAEGASLRYVNDSRLFGRRSSTEDVAPLEAASLALYKASGMKKKKPYVSRRNKS